MYPEEIGGDSERSQKRHKKALKTVKKMKYR